MSDKKIEHEETITKVVRDINECMRLLVGLTMAPKAFQYDDNALQFIRSKLDYNFYEFMRLMITTAEQEIAVKLYLDDHGFTEIPNDKRFGRWHWDVLGKRHREQAKAIAKLLKRELK